MRCCARGRRKPSPINPVNWLRCARSAAERRAVGIAVVRTTRLPAGRSPQTAYSKIATGLRAASAACTASVKHAAWSQCGSPAAVVAIASTACRRNRAASCRTDRRNAALSGRCGFASCQSRNRGTIRRSPVNSATACRASLRRRRISALRSAGVGQGCEPDPSVRIITPARRLRAAVSTINAPVPSVSSSACGASTSHRALRQGLRLSAVAGVTTSGHRRPRRRGRARRAPPDRAHNQGLPDADRG